MKCLRAADSSREKKWGKGLFIDSSASSLYMTLIPCSLILLPIFALKQDLCTSGVHLFISCASVSQLSMTLQLFLWLCLWCCIGPWLQVMNKPPEQMKKDLTFISSEGTWKIQSLGEIFSGQKGFFHWVSKLQKEKLLEFSLLNSTGMLKQLTLPDKPEIKDEMSCFGAKGDNSILAYLFCSQKLTEFWQLLFLACDLFWFHKEVYDSHVNGPITHRVVTKLSLLWRC